MATITIINVGPIKKVENLELNKVNVFMGPQSSGKSTIAKIISFCTWVEKEVAINQSLDEYNTNGNFRKKLEDFHRLNGYFKEDTEIYYTSEVIKLQFKNNRCAIEWVDKYAYQRSKIAYIPSERNLIVLPFIQKVDMPNNNNRSFLFDWLTIKSQYNKENRVKILDLPVEYYFDENTGENHITSTDEKEQYDILLENASSGLQSLAPLIVALKYLTEWIYENEEDTSFEKQQKTDKINGQLLKELILEKFYPTENFEREGRISTGFNKFIKLLDKNDPDAKKQWEQWNQIQRNLSTPLNTQFIIEEPEQNLFPSTQRELIYHLLSSLNFDRGDRATITTHSPYILYALNNCMMAGLVYDKMRDEDKQKLTCQSARIAPSKATIYEIKNGAIKPIQGKDGLINDNYFDQKMKELMDDFYLMLNYYA